MSIACFKAKSVVNYQKVSVIAITRRIFDDSVAGCKQVGSDISSEVDTIVHSLVLENGMNAHSKTAEKNSLKGPDSGDMPQALLVIIIEILNFIKRHFLHIYAPLEVIDTGGCPFQDISRVFTVEFKF